MIHEWVLQQKDNLGWWDFDILLAETFRDACVYLEESCIENGLNINNYRLTGRWGRF